MAYFLKQSKLKKGTYLQIYESYWNSETKGAKHKSYKALGYVDELINSGIEDPVEYYKKEVEKMNKARNDEISEKKQRTISESPIKNIGYFLPHGVMNRLGVSTDIRYTDIS